MDAMINAMNVEIGVFLHNLHRFVAFFDQQVSIGNKTIHLLDDTVTYIQDELLTKAKVIELPNETNTNFLQEMDPSHFELHRSIMCRLCNTSMPVTREDLHGHVSTDSHLNRLPRPALRILQPKPQQNGDKDLFLPAARNRMQKFSLASSDVEDERMRKDEQSFKINSHDSSAASLKVSKKSNSMQQRQIESDGIENFVGASWANVKAPSDSDCSWGAPLSGFNFDSKYLIHVRGLPWSATKPKITEFFENITILNGMDGIHFILNERNMKNVQAFIQLESMRDYTAAIRMNDKSMDDRRIEVLPVEEDELSNFNMLVQTLKIPSKERVVFVENLPPKYTEQDIRTLLFSGLLIDSVQFTQGETSAFVKFITIDDIEFAIQRNDEKIFIYRCTEQCMKNSRKEGNGYLASPLPSVASLRRVSSKNSAKMTDDSRSTNFMKVRGLPMTVNESYVVDLFIGLGIDGVQMERNEKGLFNGTAIVAFQHAEDYEMAIKTDLSSIHPDIKLSRATKTQFILAKQMNDKLHLNA